MDGYAFLNDTALCHPDEGMDCYHLATVYRHPLPCRDCIQAPARAVTAALLPIVQYVSRGRGYVDVERYPDAAARRALGLADAAGLIPPAAVEAHLAASAADVATATVSTPMTEAGYAEYQAAQRWALGVFGMPAENDSDLPADGDA